MSEITRSELEAQTIELLPAREEMRRQVARAGSSCFLVDTCTTSANGTSGNGNNQSTGANSSPLLQLQAGNYEYLGALR